LTYEEAVGTLCVMFPQLGRSVVEAGLRKHREWRQCVPRREPRLHVRIYHAGGAMEPTVEYLLMLDAPPEQG